MTAIGRVLSASLASWVRIAVVIVSQVAAVPVFLHYWDVETYGVWLLLQSIIGIVTLADVANQNYLGYEFLKIGTLNKERMADLFCSALPVSLFVSALTFALLVTLVFTHTLSDVLEINASLVEEFNLALVILAATWVVTGSVGGIIGRVLYPFNYYPVLAWAGTFFALISAVTPVVAVLLGANFTMVAITASVTTVTYNIGLMAILVPLVKSQGLFAGRMKFLDGLVEFVRSTTLALQSGLDVIRQQGTRLVLLPMAGMAPMTAFSTMRTGANFAQQGLSTITGPVMPELMRFLAMRDQARTESAFAIVWLVLCAVLSPAIVIVQWLAPALFPLWTHGKIAFDPWLFGMLSLGVSVLALAQPAAAVLQGNNILRAQLGISIVAAVVAVGGMALLVPLMGVRGAAAALLAAELTSLSACVWVAQQWLREQGMHWPWKAFSAAAAAVPVTALGMVALELLPAGLTLAGLAVVFVLRGLVAILYWRQLPALARTRATSLLARFMPASLRPTVAPPAATGSAPKP